MKREERNAIREAHFSTVTRNSWTYKRLTAEEETALKQALFSAPLFGSTRFQVTEEIQAIYLAFQLALGYKPIGWREPEPEAAPTF